MARTIQYVPDLGVKQIYDDFHGLIPVTKKELNIIDLPLFQRLRNIKQLGLACLVFPGGIHNRFSHSLGVLSILERLVRQLEYFDDKPQEVEILRMAALLHDIGHLPLSHTIETVYKNELENTDEHEDPEIMEIRRAGQLHEGLSRYVIQNTDYEAGVTRILTNVDLDPADVGNIIIGSHDIPLYNHLINSKLDADQMDYLLRDAKNIGINYGSYEVNYLLSCIKSKTLDETDRNRILYLDYKGLHPVEYYLLAYYFYYTQILYHAKREIVEMVAGVLFQIALRRGIAPTISELLNWIKEGNPRFLSFQDIWFHSQLDVMYQDGEALRAYPLLRRLIDAIRHRSFPHLIKRVTEEIITVEKNSDAENGIRERIRDEGFVEHVTYEHFQRGQIKKVVKTNFIKSEQELGLTRDALLGHGEAISIENFNHEITPVNCYEGSLAFHLSRIRTYILREYRIERE